MRLFSRKNGWFRISRLAYTDEIGDLQPAANEICSYEDLSAKTEPMEPEAGPSSPRQPNLSVIIIDDDDFGDEHKPVLLDVDPLTNRPVDEVKREIETFGLSRFGINEKILADRSDIDELLALLSLDELKALGKDLKIGGKTTRSTLIAAIKQNASNQSTLTSMFAAQAAAAANKLVRKGSKGKGKGKAPSPALDVQTQIKRQTELVIKKRKP